VNTGRRAEARVTPPEASSRGRLLARGITWNTGYQFFEVGLTFGAMLVLVRIIPPVEYGRFGAVLGLLMLLNSFGFGGFVAQAMQLTDGREPDWSLHWSAGLGVTMTLRGFFPATVAGVLSRVPGGERVSGRLRLPAVPATSTGR